MLRKHLNFFCFSLMFTDVSENFTTYEFKQLKFLTLKNREAFENNIPSIAHFNEKLAIFISMSILIKYKINAIFA